ncbi:SDR family oxidoreductase [Streptomyces sp. DSM 42041]|uniref:SDR family oxidoreductase n=1 Tax=Streptomyces hazeniae TaxID=3075538 RepID=A0ABU2NRJ4_9ACTN|nr:SDR family oxidoreductase [Streptomyces sp. DSM 42041]MDT0379604.1 SDR family oxidoreductase [Streptomyces sp. DSM 42041]
MARVSVISGGGTGIGRATAERFARDGDRVVLLGRRAEVLETAADDLRARVAGAEVSTRAVDLAEPAQVEELCAELAQRYGRVDVLVNNAGGNVEIGAPAEATKGLAGAAAHWTGNFRSNVLTAVLLTEGLRDLLASPGGRVVLLSSIAAFRGSGTGSYAAAKAALHPYAYDLAGALGPRGVTVNAVAPGYIEDTEFFRGGMTDARRRVLVEQTDTGRAGVPEDVADTVHWLCSPGAGHVTGQIVQVNGGARKGN